MSISHPNYPQSLFAPSRVIAAPPSQRLTYRVLPQPQYPPQPQYLPQPQYYPPPQYSYGQSLAPQYLVQPVPIVRRHPQFDLNPNFDYQSANLLCQSKIVQSTVFCVVCGSEYKMSEKQQHIQKHIRKPQDKHINHSVLQKVQDYHKKQNKPTYTVRPIVEPEEVDVHYDPNVYQLIQQTIYENQEEEDKREAGIGQDTNNSFNVFDNNVTISQNNALNILPTIDSQPNPFFSRYDHIDKHEYEVPQFHIPPPQPQPIVYEQPDQPVVYNNSGVLKQNPKDRSHHLPQQSFQEYIKQQPVNLQKQPVVSGRFESQQPNVEFPPEPAEHYGSKEVQEQQFSGPHQIRESMLSQKKSEVSLSQFIQKLNTEPIVVQDRRRIANQSEW